MSLKELLLLWAQQTMNEVFFFFNCLTSRNFFFFFFFSPNCFEADKQMEIHTQEPINNVNGLACVLKRQEI